MLTDQRPALMANRRLPRCLAAWVNRQRESQKKPTVSWRFGLALLLAGYLLFAHGCHGDKDNELFSRTCVFDVEGMDVISGE